MFFENIRPKSQNNLIQDWSFINHELRPKQKRCMHKTAFKKNAFSSFFMDILSVVYRIFLRFYAISKRLLQALYFPFKLWVYWLEKWKNQTRKCKNVYTKHFIRKIFLKDATKRTFVVYLNFFSHPQYVFFPSLLYIHSHSHSRSLYKEPLIN